MWVSYLLGLSSFTYFRFCVPSPPLSGVPQCLSTNGRPRAQVTLNLPPQEPPTGERPGSLSPALPAPQPYTSSLEAQLCSGHTGRVVAGGGVLPRRCRGGGGSCAQIAFPALCAGRPPPPRNLPLSPSRSHWLAVRKVAMRLRTGSPGPCSPIQHVRGRGRLGLRSARVGSGPKAASAGLGGELVRGPNWKERGTLGGWARRCSWHW